MVRENRGDRTNAVRRTYESRVARLDVNPAEVTALIARYESPARREPRERTLAAAG